MLLFRDLKIWACKGPFVIIHMQVSQKQKFNLKVACPRYQIVYNKNPTGREPVFVTSSLILFGFHHEENDFFFLLDVLFSFPLGTR